MEGILKDTILFGDYLQTLKQFDEKARCCITSPPYYGLRDYGGEDCQIGLEESPEEYIQKLVEVFREVRNNLTEDGTLWLNMGDSYYNYRPGKGQALVKQTVANSKQDLPDKCARRGIKHVNQTSQNSSLSTTAIRTTTTTCAGQGTTIVRNNRIGELLIK